MSHFSHVRTQMVDKACLLQALRDLGYTVSEGALSIGGFAWQKTPVEVRVETEGYAIGFRKEGGVWVLVGDWWGVRGLSRTRFLRLLAQRYAYLAARAQLEKEGFVLTSEDRDKDGRIHLVLRRVQ